MKVRGKLVEWLIEIDPTAYLPHVVIKKVVKTLYLVIKKVIYGMLEAGLMWYRHLRTNLEAIDFRFNPYDPSDGGWSPADNRIPCG